MAEAQAVESAAKSKTVYTPVTMTDGRVVQFPGKRKVEKETIIDSSKVELDEASGIIQIQAGAISVRMDFVNGDTRTYPIPLKLLARFVGHGGEQKLGDELASKADEPMSPEDMVLATDALYDELSKGNWGKGRAAGGGGVAGAALVLQAIMEATGKSLDVVKAYIQKRLDDSAARDGDAKLTRAALYSSFKAAGTKTGEIYKRLEEARTKKAAKVDADAELSSIV
jgi:hypothetical protein